MSIQHACRGTYNLRGACAVTVLHSRAFSMANIDTLRKTASPFLLPPVASNGFVLVCCAAVRLGGGEPYLMTSAVSGLARTETTVCLWNMLWHLGQPAIDDKSTRQDGLERFIATAKWRPNLTRLNGTLTWIRICKWGAGMNEHINAACMFCNHRGGRSACVCSVTNAVMVRRLIVLS